MSIFLAAESAFTAFLNPARGDAVAALGELTGRSQLKSILSQMTKDTIGRRILRERPMLNSTTLDIPKLKSYHPSTFGRCFVDFMETNNISIDSREPVRYIHDEEIAYVMTRYRQVHDFWHTLSGFPDVSVESELAVKWFEYTALGLPVAMLSSFVGPLSLPADRRAHLLDNMVPWAVASGGSCKKNLLNIYYEELLATDLKDVQKELGITPYHEQGHAIYQHVQ